MKGDSEGATNRKKKQKHGACPGVMEAKVRMFFRKELVVTL